MGVRRRLRSVRLTGNKRARERRSQSICLVVIFFAFFACILLTEVFLVDKQDGDSGNSGGAAGGIWSKLGFTPESGEQKEVVVPPRIARELARVVPELLANESSEYGDDSDRLTTAGSGNLSRVPEDRWQPVQGTRDKFYVFSAYLDERKVRTIRVVAAARTRIAERVVCVFWYANGDPPTTVYATNKLIRENWNLKYSAYFLLCPLRRDIVTIPGEVSILKQGSNEPSNRLIVHNNKVNAAAEPKGLAICVKPLHYNYNKVLDFVEFIELNRLLGVRHFVFYNHTVGPEVDCALKRYERVGLVTLLPWKLDMISQKEIRTEGLFAALNDCLYRTMYRFRYVLMIDLDELVVPHSNSSIPNMLNSLISRNPSRVGAFSFQNAFFYLQWENEAGPLDYPLLTLLKTRRKAKLHAHKQRSKCIVMPDRVVEMGNHFVWEFMPGKTMQNVHPDMGFLHHYRVCEFGGSDCINTTFLVDRRIYAWREPLLRAVASALSEMSSTCGFTVARNGTIVLHHART